MNDLTASNTGAPVARPLAVLHIEDNMNDRDLVRATLAAGGLESEITYAKARGELLAALDRRQFDLILADYSMPGFGGAEALRMVRQRSTEPAFIFVSGTIGEERAVESMKAGATDYVLKDRLERLVTVVRRALQESRERAERRQAEAQLRETRERLDRVLANSPAIIYSLRIVGDLRVPSLVSENVEALLGHPVADVLAPGWWDDHLHPEDRARVKAGFDCLLERDTVTQEYRLRGRDGRYHWIEDKQRVIRHGSDSPVEIAGVWTDVTDRKLADERVREQAALLDEANDAIYVHDMTGVVRFWNRAAGRLYGWNAAEVVGQPVSLFLPRTEVEAEMIRDALLRNGSWSREVERTDREGGRRIVLSRHTLLRDGGGRPDRVLVIDADLTEKKQLESQFLRAQRMEAVGALAGGIAHDLNNVLAPILMSVEVLEEQIGDPTARRMLETVKSCSRRGADLVRQVLSFARGVEGRRVVVNLQHLLRETQTLVEETFPRNIQTSFRLQREAWRVAGDPTQLNQVVMNLCVNARDAMPNGGTLTVSLENVRVDDALATRHAGARPGDHVLIKVADTGVGIPHALHERIFEAFYTTKGEAHGTGLGLSTTMRIVRSHGGFIRVNSDTGRGAEFEVYLPSSDGTTDAAFTGGERGELPRGAGQCVLVVDDEESIRAIARMILENFGYRVLVASHGAEAVSMFAARREEIALVLTDMVMPIMDGPATIAAIKKLDPAARIVCSSGNSVESSMAAARKHGVTHFLPKPYAAAQLLQTVAAVLGGHARAG